MQLSKRLSFRTIAYVAAAALAIWLVASTTAGVLLLKDSYEEHQIQQLRAVVTGNARTLSQELHVFAETINHVATQPTTQDVLERKNRTGAQQWALQMRRFFPQALGVALLAADGTLLGEPDHVHLTDQCLSDLNRLAQGLPGAQPLAHRATNDARHFDLTAPVRDESGNALGILFVTFDMNRLNKLLGDMGPGGQFARIIDGENRIVTQVGDPNADSDRELSAPIPDTQWTLSMRARDSDHLPRYAQLGLMDISFMLLALAAAFYFTRFAVRAVHADLHSLAQALEAAPNGALATRPDMQLRESGPLASAVERLARKSHDARQDHDGRSRTDELTGLPNQTAFADEFSRAYHFARRGAVICLVFMEPCASDPGAETKPPRPVLRQLAKTLRTRTRKTDYTARIDTQRFALLLYGMEPEQIAAHLRKLTDDFRKNQNEAKGTPPELIYTLSFGYTCMDTHRDHEAGVVLARAEAALDEALKAGDGTARGRLFSEPPP